MKGRGGEPTLSRYRSSHMHACGHVDDCFLARDVAEAEPCPECKTAKFNRDQVGKASKPPAGMVRVGLVW